MDIDGINFLESASISIYLVKRPTSRESGFKFSMHNVCLYIVLPLVSAAIYAKI
jgi:hypothetical protein